MRSIALGLWEFVVGDDWRVAIGIAAMLGATALATAADLPAWWLSPLATLLILQRAVRRAQRRADAS
ncbi:MAG TPA: hypothetical protein VGO66_10690 [Solirubrobacterales bacterium]|jgi:hypothetical protein|nr:hypothetical protein [Solirubrobacterales bacterium]